MQYVSYKYAICVYSRHSQLAYRLMQNSVKYLRKIRQLQNHHSLCQERSYWGMRICVHCITTWHSFNLSVHSWYKLEKGTLPFLRDWLCSLFQVTNSIILNFEVFRIPRINPSHTAWPQHVPLKWSQVTAAARSKAWTVLALSNSGIVGSYPTPGM
jgi:hypothetical protein